MKKHAVMALTVFGIAFFVPNDVSAATKYWIGAAGGSVLNNAYWSTSSGGPNNTTAPGASDIATFDGGTTTNAVIDATLSVGGIDIKSAYTGTISQAAALTVGTSNFSQAGGSFTVTVATSTTHNGTFTLSGGTYTASAATTTIFKSFTRTAGTFVHNNGAVVISAASGDITFAASGVTFYDITFTQNAFAQRTIFIDQSFNASGTLRMMSEDSGGFASTVSSRSSFNPTVLVQNLDFPDTAPAGNRNIGSASAASNFTIGVAGNYSQNESAVLLYANIVFNGSGTQTINKSAGYIDPTSQWSSTKPAGTLTIQSYGYTSTDMLTWAGGDVSVSGNTCIFNRFTLSGGNFTASSATSTVRGDFTRTGGTFIHNGGTIYFEAITADFAIAASGVTFNNVTFTSTAGNFRNIYIDQNFSASGTMRFLNESSGGYSSTYVSRNSANPTLSVQNLDLLDNTFVAARAIGSATAASNFTIAIAGNFSQTESVSTLYANVIFNGTGDQVINKSAGAVDPTSQWSSTKTEGTLTFQTYATAAVTDKITWNSGSVAVTGSSVVFNKFTLAGGTFTASSATTTFKNDFVRTGGTFAHNNGTVYVDPGADLSFSASGATFNNITFSSNASTFRTVYIDSTFNASGTLRIINESVGGYSSIVASRSSVNPTVYVQNFELSDTPQTTRTIGSGTASDNFTIAIFGNFTMSESVASLYAILKFSGSGTSTISRTAGTINAASVWSVDKSGGAAVLGTTIAHPATITVVEGVLDMNGVTPLTATGGITVQDGGVLKLKGTETLTAPTLSSGSTVWYYGTTSSVTMKGYTYDNLTVGGAGNTFTPTTTLAALTVNGNVNILAGTLDLASRNLTLGGSSTFSNDDTFKLTGGQTLTNFTNDTNSGTTTYYGTSTYSSLNAGNNYYNLSFGSTIGGSYTLNATLDVNGDLTIGSSTLLAAGNGITLAGMWSNSGTYTHGNNTVTLDGTSQTLTGSNNTTFYNLSKVASASSTLTFNNARTFTISNNTTLKGTTTARLSLRSLTSGSQSPVNYSNSGARDIQYVDVKDNNNTNATAVTCSTGCANSGNNLNWLFIPDAPTSFAGSALSSTSIQWTWTDNATGETGFKLYNSSTNALITTIATPNATSYTETGLTASTSYGRYLTAYGTDGASASSTFATSTTNPPAFSTVTTQAATATTTTTATLNGTITDVGATAPTVRGFAYGLTTAYGATTTESGSFGNGAFSVSISSLTCGQTYHFRAYAVNQAGTSTGADLTFSTAGQCTPVVTTSAASSIAATGATLNGNITNAGVGNPTTRGFFYGLTTGYGSTTSESGSFSTGAFTSTISSLACNTAYHFQAYAVNTYGTSTGSDQTFSTLSQCTPVVTTSAASSITQTGATLNGSIDDIGQANATSRGFAWGLTSAHGATTTETGSFSAGAFTASISSLTCNTQYHIIAYAVNSAGTSYGSDTTFTTSPCTPTVTTQPASSVTLTSATLNGSITATGGSNATVRGFAYGLTTAYGATTTETGSFSTGIFNSDISSLTCDTTYHFNAYAENAAGVAYGSDQTLSTGACPVAQRSSSSGSHSSSGGQLPPHILAPLLVPGAATDDYIRSLGQPASCPTGYICTPLAQFPSFLSTSTLSAAKAAFSRSLRSGDTGSDVRLLQIYLNTHGSVVSSSGPGSPGHETTLFGAKTKAALIKFQRAHGISGTGFFGPVTRAYVNSH